MQSVYLQRSPRLCGWSTALRRCAGSPRSACKRVGSRTARSRCAHRSSRSKGSVKRTESSVHTTLSSGENTGSDRDGLLMLRTSSRFLRKQTAFAFPPSSLKLCSAGRLRRRRFLFIQANYKPLYIERWAQARMEEWPRLPNKRGTSARPQKQEHRLEGNTKFNVNIAACYYTHYHAHSDQLMD